MFLQKNGYSPHNWPVCCSVAHCVLHLHERMTWCRCSEKGL